MFKLLETLNPLTKLLDQRLLLLGIHVVLLGMQITYFFPGAKLETLKIFKTLNSFEDCCLVTNRIDCKLVS